MTSVQYLRGVAALLVVVYDAVYKHGQISGISSSWSFGQSGVDLFFIISGFIMSYTTDRRAVGGVAFFKARMARILPLYWSLSIAAFLVFLVSPRLINRSGGTTTILHSFTLFPVGDKLLIQNGWTLSFEFWFYIIFAAALAMGTSHRIPKASAILLVLFVIGYVFTPTRPALEVATNPLLLEFFMGMIAFLYFKNIRQKVVVNVILLFIGLVSLVYVGTHGIVENQLVSYGVPFMLVVCGLVGMESLMNRLPTMFLTRILRAIGDSSYSLYLIHPFVISVVAIVVVKARLAVLDPFTTLILVVSSCVVGYICYLFIECKLNALFRARRHGPASPDGTHALPQ